jgi:hypothetical protein
MKHITTAALIMLSVGVASAAPFGNQQQVGSDELDPSNREGPAMTAQPFAASVSLETSNYEDVMTEIAID